MGQLPIGKLIWRDVSKCFSSMNIDTASYNFRREVLKNVAYSIKMGLQLSHSGSKSFRYNYDRSDAPRFPDENYAR